MNLAPIRGAPCSGSPLKWCASRCSCCLLGAGSIYLLMATCTRPLILLRFRVRDHGITILQERRTEKALDSS